MTTHVLALANQKGGVGKTSITVGLADALARQGRRVLVIDADPQANATANLGIDQAPQFTLNDVLAVDPTTRTVAPGVIAEAIVPAGEGWTGVDVVAAELALSNREQDQDPGREARLRTAMDGALDAYDVVLIDCPPNLGQLTINALTAADAALLVTEPRAPSVDGLTQMTRTVGTVRQHYNPALRLAGVVVNRHRTDRRDRVEWVDQLREDYGTRLLEPYLPEREVIAVATSAAAPLSAYGPRGRDVLDALTAIADQITTTTGTAGATA
ncbi:ParA family protein [Pseudokineococcus sp. 5B2Z-1]|uniref:ParA family protein n=1 Tax=Pseudokineococcus sp. 5B2Z-1 TaxID=3132744 RepID=UPI00309E7F1A